MTQDILIKKLTEVYHNFQELSNKNIKVLESSYFDIFHPQSSYSIVRNAIKNKDLQVYFSNNYTREIDFLFRNFTNIIEDVNQQGIKDYFTDLEDKTESQHLFIQLLVSFNKVNSSFRLDYDRGLNFKIHLFNEVYQWGNSEINNQILEITKRHYLKVLSEFHFYYIASRQMTKKNLTSQEKPELTINQIALKYVYEGQQVTRENGNEIANLYGHNSGEKLFQRFTFYSSAANRKGKPNPCTLKKLQNKIKLIESIIELLPPSKQQRPKDEVLILRKVYKAEYE